MEEPTYQPIDISLLGAEHVRRYQETEGEVGYLWNGVATLLLTTTGRRSGEPRTTPLIFGRHDDAYLVVASMGGAPNHPQWYLNLQAEPRATIQVQAEYLTVTARDASGDEKPALWKVMTGIWPNYHVYQSRTERLIPVVVLTPVEPS